jgi:hypothetical protein
MGSMINDIVEQLERVVWAVRVGVSLAAWLSWMQLGAVAALAAGLGWVARGMREARGRGSIYFNTTTGLYEAMCGGRLYQFVDVAVTSERSTARDAHE